MPFLTLVPAHSIADAKHMVGSNGRIRINDLTFRHRAVMGLFGEYEGNVRADNNILFRLELTPGRAPSFLIQSDIAPENLPADAQVKEFSFGDYHQGQPVQFRLAVNAVVRRTEKRADGREGEVVTPVPMDDATGDENTTNQLAMTEWLGQKLAPALDTVEIVNHQREVLSAAGGYKGNKNWSIQVDVIDGVATVGDVEALAKFMHEGVGRAKAYGCGLLTVRALG